MFDLLTTRVVLQMKIDLLYQHNLVYAKLLCCWPSRFRSATNLGAVLSSRGWVC